MRIKGANIRLLKNPTPAEVRPTLEALRAAGVNAVAINTIHYMPVGVVDGAATLTDVPLGRYPRSRLVYADIGQDGQGIHETASIDRVFAVAEMALDMGFERVVLKPMVDAHWPDGGRGGWRGYVRIPKRLARRFADDYAEFLVPYAHVAQELECDLCMGTEMWLLTKELGAQFWVAQAEELRSYGFSRQLTYAANWGNPDNPEAEYFLLRDLWASPFIDYVGIDAYYPFEGVEAAPARWDYIVRDLEAMKHRHGKPIVFTEIGYPNRDYAAQEPWGRDDPAGEHTTAVSGELWRIARSKLEGVLDGWYAWEAGLGDTKGATHDILGSGLEPVVWGQGS